MFSRSVRHARAAASALCVLLVAGSSAPALAAEAWEPPPPEVASEASAIIARMKANPRGPYLQLRWYCNDGTVHPPMPYPCEARGGGHQHGEYTTDRQRLVQLGYYAGTIFTGTEFEELWSAQPRQGRLRQLAMERYLIEVDDGWVLRKARTYRGRVQVEDEEEAGRELLLELLGRRDFVRDNFLLVRESMRAIPHRGAGGDRTRDLRRVAKDIALQDRSFEEMRVKIHNEPGIDDVAGVDAWIADASERGAPAARVEAARKLVKQIEELYGPAARTARLRAAVTSLGTAESDAPIARAFTQAAEARGAHERTAALSTAIGRIRDAVESGVDPAHALELLDLSVDAETEAVAAGSEVASDAGTSRATLLSLAASLLDAAYGSGLLSARERDELALPAREMAAQSGDVPTERYLETAKSLERASAWAAGSVRHAFAETLAIYSAIEPKAAQFTDDLLRGSALLPLARVASSLARDGERRSGLLHHVMGRDLAGVAGINPGAATGKLRVLTADEFARGVTPLVEEIVVLAATTSELTPVAGIITVSEGNALSHVQMLARNLGIPNASVPEAAVAELTSRQGQDVLFAVAADGSVVLTLLSEVSPALRELMTGEKKKASLAAKVDAPVPDLSHDHPLALAQLHAGLSGKLVGPKAANVGELAHHFPGKVAPAVAVPFGIYARHAASGDSSPKARLDRAFARHRAGEIDDTALAAAVELMRTDVAALTIDAATRAEIAAAVRKEFGTLDAGAFVRSDTNVEDLPQFTGAGLNKTVANVVGLDAQIAAIPLVWSSPFTKRAMAWRAQALTKPEEVYPSVLIMKSVPAEKSGVLATADVVTGGVGSTLAIAWGVGGAVDGEAAETLVFRPDGTTTLASEAKTPYRRRLKESGGVEWVPAPSGRVLEPDEERQVRDLIRELDEKLEPSLGDDGKPMPWDVELGFLGGKLVLFQVRPLVAKGAALAGRVVETFAPKRAPVAATTPLGEPPATHRASAKLDAGPTHAGLLPSHRLSKSLYCTLAEYRP